MREMAVWEGPGPINVAAFEDGGMGLGAKECRWPSRSWKRQ